MSLSLDDVPLPQRLELTQTLGRLGYWLATPDGKQVRWSDELYRIFGREPGTFEPTLEAIQDCLLPEYRASAVELVKQSVARLQPFVHEVRIARPDGSWRQLRVEGCFEQDARGRQIYLGIARDVTERAEAQQLLLDKHRLLERAQLTAGLGYWHMSLPDRHHSWSDHLAEIYGFAAPTEEAFLELIDEADRPGVTRIRDEAIAAGRGYAYEAAIGQPDGSRRIIRVESEPERAADGSLAGVFGITQDITRLRRTEISLSHSTERHRRILMALDKAGVSLDVTDAKGVVEDANMTARELCGVSHAASLIGKTWRQIYGDLGLPFSETFDRLYWERLARGDSQPMEQVLGLPDGSTRTRLMSVARMDDGRLVNLTMDITEHKQLEERQRRIERHLEHTQRMEALGLLAGGVAHEINNILHPIMSFAELARDEDDKSDRDALIERVLDCVRLAKGIVGDVLSFARPPSAEPEPQPLAKLLDDSVRFARDLIRPQARILCDNQLGATLVRLHGSELLQVLLNLVHNAIDAMPQGGTIRIAGSIAPPEVDGCDSPVEGAAGRALITVADEGTGMTEEVCRRVFEPFFTTKPIGKGTGLGLAVVYGVVRRWGGSVEIASKPGEGTEVRLLLPIVGPVVEDTET